MATEIGIIKTLIGTAVATAADGSQRNLQAGDRVYQDEIITTGAAGAVEVEFTDGSVMTLGRSSQIVLDTETFNPLDVAEAPADAASEVDALQQALLEGADPTQIGEATAAGAGAGAGGNEGSDFVTVDYLAPEVTPTSGFDTTGITVEFDELEEEIPGPEEDDLPIVSVSVTVQIDVENPDDPRDPPTTGDPTPENPVIVSGNAASILEGTNGSEGREVTFLLSLDKVFDQDVDVTYELRPISADNPEDWFDGDLIKTVTIPAGETTFPVTVTIVQDHLDEGNEVFDIIILSATNATVNPAADTAVVTIFDDDTTPVANPDTNWVDAASVISGEDFHQGGEGNDIYPGEDQGEDSILLPTTSGNVLNDVDHTFDPTPGEDGDEIAFQDAADTDEDGDSLVVTGVVAHGDDGTLGGGDDTVGTIGSPVDGVYGTLVLNSDGSYEYQVSEETLELTFGQSVQDQFTYTVTDTYNQPQTTTLTITIVGSNSGVEITNLTPQVEGGDVVVDEDGLEGSLVDAARTGETDSTENAVGTGTFVIDAPDGVGNLNINGNTIISNGFFSAISFTTPEGNTLSITGYDSNTGEVSYSYELEESEDHGAVQGENSIYENLTVNLTDTDGDFTSGTLSVQIVDDIPSVDVIAGEDARGEDGVEEQEVLLMTQDADTVGAASDTISSTGDFSGVFSTTPTYGADGAGTTVTTYSLALASGVTDGDDSGLDSGGSDVLLRDNSGVIEGYVGGTVIFTIDVNASGAVTLTQNEVIDHIEGGSDDDIIELGNGLVELTASALTTDADGDTATDSETVDLGDNIRFEDDEPEVVADTGAATEGALLTVNAASGVLADDTSGADDWTAADAGVVGVVAGSNTAVDTENGLAAIETAYGTLTLAADGSYTYQAKANVVTDNSTTDSFVYTVKDGDGDLESTTLVISLADVSLSADNDTIQVDEAALSFGSNPGSTDETAGGALAVTGAVSYAFASGTDGAGNKGTLTLNANGTYSYTLLAAVASGAVAGANTVNAVETFNYTATDANGNTVDGTIVVNVVDDIPSISSPDGTVKNAASESLTGIIDFDLGADGAGGIDLSLISSPVGLMSNGLTVQYAVEDTNNDGFEELRAYTTAGDVFIISQDGSDSQYSLDMLDTLDLTDTFTNSFANGVTGNGPTGSVDFTTTDGATDFVIRLSSPDDVNNSAGKIGVDNQNMNDGETLTIEFFTDDLSGNYDVNGITLGLFNFGNGESFTYTLHNGATQVGSGTVSGPLDDSQPLLGTSDYDRIEIEVVNGNFKFDDISGQGSSSFDAVFELGAVATDSDADATDAAAGTYTVTIGDSLDTLLGSDDDIPVS